MGTIKQLIEDIRLTCDNIRETGDYEFAKTLGHLADQWEEVYVNSDISGFVISEEQIADACNKAYFQVGHNAYFGNGFTAGVKFTEQHYQSEKAELVECLEFVNKEISKYKYDHKIVGHLGKCQFKIEQLLTKMK